MVHRFHMVVWISIFSEVPRTENKTTIKDTRKMVDGFHMVVRIPIFQTNVQQLEGKYIRRFFALNFLMVFTF
jgi:hypothetical protein